jgi:soluble lytic murein transglycosylase-like protein
MKLTAALLLVGSYLCCTGTPVKADSVDDSLYYLCGSRGAVVAPLVRQEARRFLLPGWLLASLIAVESACKVEALGKHNDTSLGQIIPGGAAATSPILGRPFTWTELWDPATNVYVTARYLAYNLTTCDKGLEYALTGYNQREGCRKSKYARKVLRALPKAIKHAMEGRRS